MNKVHLLYADLLFDELKKRCEKNSKYSLRSFSRDLSISPSFLSRVLRRENALTLKKAEIFSKKLPWSTAKRELFFQLIHYHNCVPGATKELLAEQLGHLVKDQNIDSLTLSESFQSLLLHWHDFAIVELTLHPDFKSSPQWIANRLSLSLEQSKESLQRLLLLGKEILLRCLVQQVPRIVLILFVSSITKEKLFALPLKVLYLMERQ